MVGMSDSQSPYRMRPENLLPKFESAKNPFATKTEPAKIPTAIPAIQTAATPKVAPMETYPLFDNDLKPVAASAPAVAVAGKMVPVCALSDLGVVTERPAAEVLAVAKQYLAEINSQQRRLPHEEVTVGLMDAHPLGLKTGAPARESLPDPVVAPVKAPVKPAQPAPAKQPASKPEQQSSRTAAKATVVGKKKFAWLTPLVNLLRRGSAQAASPKKAVQTELSLERVKVLRNDLSDADLEVVTIRRSEPQQGGPLRLQPMTQGEGGLSRITSRIFGNGQQLVR